METIRIILPHSLYRDFLIRRGHFNITAHDLLTRLIVKKTEEEKKGGEKGNGMLIKSEIVEGWQLS